MFEIAQVGADNCSDVTYWVCHAPICNLKLT